MAKPIQRSSLRKIQEEGGFSLIELMLVVGIVAILMVIAGIQYSRWINKYNVESEIRELHSDLLTARAKAMTKNRFFFVRLATNRYTIYEDTYSAALGATTPDGDGTLQTGSDARNVDKTLKPQYPLMWAGDAQMNFNTRGMWDNSAFDTAIADNTKFICSNANINADNNCIVISATRINLGKLNRTIPSGGACDTANCVVK